MRVTIPSNRLDVEVVTKLTQLIGNSQYKDFEWEINVETEDNFLSVSVKIPEIVYGNKSDKYISEILSIVNKLDIPVITEKKLREVYNSTLNTKEIKNSIVEVIFDLSIKHN